MGFAPHVTRWVSFSSRCQLEPARGGYIATHPRLGGPIIALSLWLSGFGHRKASLSPRSCTRRNVPHRVRGVFINFSYDEKIRVVFATYSSSCRRFFRLARHLQICEPLCVSQP